MTTVTVRDDPSIILGANTDLFVVSSYSFSNRQAFAPMPTELWYDTAGGGITILRGAGFIYDRFQNLESGTITAIEYRGQLVGTSQNISAIVVTGLSIPVAQYVDWGFSGGDTPFREAAFGGGDQFVGGGLADLMRAYGGADSMTGGGGGDTLEGGQGSDTISGGLGDDNLVGGDGARDLRGDEGDDRITGGAGFDDANGNMGSDTVSTGAGNDFSVGGKDNDLLFGDGGND
ncbi:MAG: calcium-binding protein, partial [Bradyrhizobium sp.]